MSLLATNYWAWHPHPEVWILVGAIFGLYLWAGRTIGPKVVPAGTPPVTRSQRTWFLAGIAVMWLAADWPIHDIGESYLYFVHMIQHLLLTLVVPPMLLMGTPEWLARLIIGDGTSKSVIRWFCRPVVAGLLYNAMVILTHWPVLVNNSVKYGAMHYGVHVIVLTTSLAMWMSVCGPIKEWRQSLPSQMVYLFLMSVIPTIPGAWLTFASGSVYKAYDIPQRMWNLSVTSDQQAAGLIMKLAGGTYLWTIITVLFFRWAQIHEQAERAGRLVSERDVLTWNQVSEEFERLGPAPADEPKPPKTGADVAPPPKAPPPS